MAQVSIEINGRPYVVGCEDGQEAHLRELAATFDVQVRQVSAQVGQLGETRLFLLAALLMADELNESRLSLNQVRAELGQFNARHEGVEGRAAAAIDAAARRIEALAARATLQTACAARPARTSPTG